MKTKFILFAIVSLLFAKLNAQENIQKPSQNFTLSADLVSNYVWRGLVFSDAPNVQPYLAFSTNNGIFTMGTFGSYSLAEYYSEVDVFASLNIGMFSFSVWDYFVMTGQTNNRFFNFNNETTGHAVEAAITFNGPESFPLLITSGMFVYGADKNPEGDNNYSSYIELAYPFKWKSNNLTLFAGITPKEGLYASEFAMHNIGITNSREIKVNEIFSIPIKGSVVINPYLENIHFVLAVTLAAND
jgi:hypothetical protein